MLERLWVDRTLGLLTVAGLATGFALASGWLTPRGPITTTEALTAMIVALAVGMGAGLVSARRWSLLVAPAAFVLVFELIRMGVDGPTVDDVSFGFYGIVALILGRGLHGLLVLVPMVVGAVYGVRMSARLGSDATSLGKTAWTLTGLMTVALVVLAVFVARPATTAPIPGPDGETAAG